MGLVAPVLLALLGYVVIVLALQRSVLFPRPPAPAHSPADGRQDVEIVRLGPHDVEAWFLAAPVEARPAPVLVFTHGNGELIDHWLGEMETPQGWGMGILLVEYPGYGRSGGSPSESSIRETMVAAYDWLVTRDDVDGARILAHGRSLGGGAACLLARERKVAALILESSFTGVRPLALRSGVLGPLVLDPFDNLEVVSGFEGPVLVLHGTRDRIIPVSHGRELASAARDGELHELDCGHNDSPRPWKLIHQFLGTHGILR
jgi:hypothetical protein